MTDGVKDVTIIVWYFSVAFLNYHYSYPILANHGNKIQKLGYHRPIVMCDVTRDEKWFLDFVSANDAGWYPQNVANMD